MSIAICEHDKTNMKVHIILCYKKVYGNNMNAVVCIWTNVNITAGLMISLPNHTGMNVSKEIIRLFFLPKHCTTRKTADTRENPIPNKMVTLHKNK